MVRRVDRIPTRIWWQANPRYLAKWLPGGLCSLRQGPSPRPSGECPFTPIETQPERVRPIASLFPLTYFCHGFRAAILRQANLVDISRDLLALFVFVVLTFGLSVLLLRIRPDVR